MTKINIFKILELKAKRKIRYKGTMVIKIKDMFQNKII